MTTVCAIALMTLAACDTAREPTGGIAADAAREVAAMIDARRGEVLGEGFSFRAARANGPVTEVDIDAPFGSTALTPVTRAAVLEGFRSAFVEAMCETAGTQIYFDYGGSTAIRLITTDDMVLGGFSVSQCA